MNVKFEINVFYRFWEFTSFRKKLTLNREELKQTYVHVSFGFTYRIQKVQLLRHLEYNSAL